MSGGEAIHAPRTRANMRKDGQRNLRYLAGNRRNLATTNLCVQMASIQHLRRDHSRFPRQETHVQKDTATVQDFAHESYRRVLQLKYLAPLDGEHFDLYLSQFEISSTVAVEWFKRHL